MVISRKLFDNILVDPMRHGANRLHVVSGYATAAMAARHMQYAKEKGYDISIRLLVGMCSNDGISRSNHHGFKKLVEEDFRDSFECSYISTPPAVHSKVYAWSRNDDPILGFVGSANYTQNAFSQNQHEAMAPCEPQCAFDYYNSLLSNSIYCTHNDVSELIKIYQERREIQQTSESENLPSHLSGLETVQISLLTRAGIVPLISGLNWGQRPGRNKGQAYIAVPARVYRTGFFPEIGSHFTVLTDDDKTMIFSRAQQSGKSLHTPHNNALLGEYFKDRLGLASDEFVVAEHLFRYGRSDVRFYKIDDETYYMDFSVA